MQRSGSKAKFQGARSIPIFYRPFHQFVGEIYSKVDILNICKKLGVCVETELVNSGSVMCHVIIVFGLLPLMFASSMHISILLIIVCVNSSGR